MTKKALLIVNLGTPDSTDPQDVGRYLTEFLTDKHVIDLPFPLRHLLVRGIIVPKRKYASSAKYKKVWMKEGSPLLYYTESLSNKLNLILKHHNVYFAMRYGNPSIKDVLCKLTDYDSITVIPLYPQDTKSSYLTAKLEVERQSKKLGMDKKISFIAPFYREDFYIDSLVDRLSKVEAEHFLFSYHGIPQHHLPATCNSCDSPCLDSKIESECYRSQCFETSRLIAHKLGLKEDSYSTSFQSRLGKKPWIKPYTDHIVEELKEKGVKKLAVISPSFIVDCLETLEELAIDLKGEFEANKDEYKLEFIPCLNDSDSFIQKFREFVEPNS